VWKPRFLRIAASMSDFFQLGLDIWNRGPELARRKTLCLSRTQKPRFLRIDSLVR
jgi:hypothetical protein